MVLHQTRAAPDSPIEMMGQCFSHLQRCPAFPTVMDEKKRQRTRRSDRIGVVSAITISTSSSPAMGIRDDRRGPISCTT
jgi:hypothetical protein